jgi:hypothetical protein
MDLQDIGMSEEEKTGYESRLTWIRNEYVELLKFSDVATLFRYDKVDLARHSHSRGTFPVKMMHIPGKRVYSRPLRQLPRHLMKLL